MEGMKNISVGDVDASRHLIDNFLSIHTAYEILPDSGKVILASASAQCVALSIILGVILRSASHSHIIEREGFLRMPSMSFGPMHIDSHGDMCYGQVVALDISLPIKQAFHVLYEQVP